MSRARRVDATARDAIVIGGGPAGLAAALVLARCRLSIEVFDSGEYRNARSPAVRGLLGHDGLAPEALRARARRELASYGVTVTRARVDAVRRVEHGFEVACGRLRLRAPALLIATGVEDRLPAVEGIDRFLGHGVHHCPYCDGFEAADGRIAVHGRGAAGAGMAMLLRQTWSRDVTLFTDGPARLTRGDRERLARLAIPVEPARVARLAGRGRLERVEMCDGRRFGVDTLFFASGQHQRSDLATRLGCDMNARGTLRVGSHGESSVAGVWIAGDASPGPQLASVAIAEGVAAAYAIHQWLYRRRIAGLGLHDRETFDAGVRAPAATVALPADGPAHPNPGAASRTNGGPSMPDRGSAAGRLRGRGGEEEVKGAVRKGVGKVKEGVGRATGNRRLVGEGKADQAEGSVRKGVGRAVRKVGEAADEVRGAARRR